MTSAPTYVETMTSSIKIIDGGKTTRPAMGHAGSSNDQTADEDTEEIYTSCVTSEPRTLARTVIESFDPRYLRRIGVARLAEAALSGKSPLALDAARLVYSERLMRGMTQHELAEAAGLSVDAVRRLETASGKNGVTLGLFLACVDALGIQLNLLLSSGVVTQPLRVGNDDPSGSILTREFTQICRGMAGMSRTELNTALGRPMGLVWRLESKIGKFSKGPTLGTLGEVARACGVTVELQCRSS